MKKFKTHLSLAMATLATLSGCGVKNGLRTMAGSTHADQIVNFQRLPDSGPSTTPPTPTPTVTTTPTTNPMTPATPTPTSTAPVPNVTFNDFSAIIKSSCLGCHGLGFSGGDFAKLKTEADWEVSGLIVAGDPLESSIYYRLAKSEGPAESQIYKTMPPGGALATSELETIKNYIIGLGKRAGSCGTPAPEFVRVRRMNRREYNNTIRDLLAINNNPALALPSDTLDEKGFDTNSDNLGATKEYVTGAVNAAEKLADQIAAASALPDPFTNCGVTDRACLKTAMSTFVTRAFRRPSTATEVDQLMTLFDAAGAGKKGLAAAIFGALSSQNFLFRLELDSAANVVRNLTDYEIATRISYFIWSSMPDAALFSLAAQGKLQDPVILRSEVARMVASPKAKEFVNGFGFQLMRLDRIGIAQPNPTTYPSYGESLKASMVNESLTFFDDLVANKLPIRNLVSANYSFVNSELAAHYGLAGSFPAQTFQKATFPADALRSGMLTQSSILTLNAGPHSGSPTRRGKWIMDRLLCNEPKPAPPGVETALPPAGQTVGLSSRQIMELHAKNPACASCHRVMDPLGFGLDHFDSIGRIRRMDTFGKAIDGSGSVFQKAYMNPKQLGEIIAGRPELNSCMSKMLFSYAVTPPKTTAQLCAVKNAATLAVSGKDNLPDMIAEIVLSPSFRKRISETR